MAWRSEPASGLTLSPLSPVVMTVKVEGASRSSSSSKPRRARQGRRDRELFRPDRLNSEENSMRISLMNKKPARLPDRRPLRMPSTHSPSQAGANPTHVGHLFLNSVFVEFTIKLAGGGCGSH